MIHKRDQHLTMSVRNGKELILLVYNERSYHSWHDYNIQYLYIIKIILILLA